MDIKSRVRTFQALKSTLHVWEVLAINRYKKYSSIVGAQLPYFLRLQEILEHIYVLYSGLRTDLLRMEEERSVDVLVLTSDRGYVGDFVTRTLRVLMDFLKRKGDKKISLFMAGRRGSASPLLDVKVTVFENVLTKDIDWEVVSRIGDTLVNRYRKGLSDACYVIFQRPEVEVGEALEIEERERKEALVEESPFFYPRFEEVLRAKPMEIVERGRYRPVIARFLPPDVKGRYSKDLVLNIEAEEEEFLDEILKLYLSFFIKEIFLEHFTSINFARYRTITRINENIEKKLLAYRVLINKLRQEKITREIEDIVLSMIGTEERRMKSVMERGYSLEVDSKIPEELKEWLLKKLEELGIEVHSVSRRNLLGGFRLIGADRYIDLSVGRILQALKLKLAKDILKP